MVVYDLVKPKSRVLDLGCATGYFGKELKKKNCITVGVEEDRKATEVAKYHLKEVVIADLENPESIKLKAKFDYVLFLDVIEHLYHRTELLTYIHRWLKPSGALIISTPNIAHISVRMQLLSGNFRYTKYGILDESHVHFYTMATLTDELQKTGWKAGKMMVSADLGQMPLVARFAKHFPKVLQWKITNFMPSLLGVQLIAVCHE